MILDTSVFKKIFENHFISCYIDYFICEENMELVEEIGCDQYLTFKLIGISFGFDKKELTSINFYSKNYDDDYLQFQKRLPFDFDFNFSRNKIREKLGKPNRIIPKEASKDIGHSDIFWFGKKYQLAIMYNDNCDGILFMQIASPPIN